MPTDSLHTLARAAAILDCFTLEHPELGVRETARMVNCSSSAAGRLLAAMKEMGILNQNPVTRAYSMGARPLIWAGVYAGTLDIRNKALPALGELHRTTHETVSLYVLDGNERLCIERLESPQNVRIVGRIGRRLPLHAGSGGKVLLAFLPPAKQEEILNTVPLDPLTPNTIVDPNQLRAELQKIRQQGYAISTGEWLTEAAGIGAPVFDQNNNVIGALTISGPTQRFTEDIVQQYIPLVTRVADQLSREMGYRGQR